VSFGYFSLREKAALSRLAGPHMRIRTARHKDRKISGGSDRPLLLIPTPIFKLGWGFVKPKLEFMG